MTALHVVAEENYGIRRRLRPVPGHRPADDRRISVFPHLCPGAGCAVRDWLQRLATRRAYEAAARKETRV